MAHQIDGEVNSHLVGSDAVGRFFSAGKWIGSAYVQAGVAAGLYAVGRYALPQADGEPKTNKVSHLGFDMLRGLIVSQAFAIATYVGMSRMHDNRHYLSDVVFGAALGIASGWTVVGRHGRSNYALTPVPVRGGFMVSMSRRPSGT